MTKVEKLKILTKTCIIFLANIIVWGAFLEYNNSSTSILSEVIRYTFFGCFIGIVVHPILIFTYKIDGHRYSKETFFDKYVLIGFVGVFCIYLMVYIYY